MHKKFTFVVLTFQHCFGCDYLSVMKLCLRHLSLFVSAGIHTLQINE